MARRLLLTTLFTACSTLALACAAVAKPGDLDPSFGGGTVMVSFGYESSAAHAILVQPDGQLVAAGYQGRNFAVARLNPDGELDRSFAQVGHTTTGFPRPAVAIAVARQGSGKLTAVGTAGDSFAFARYNADGTPDGTFGRGGQLSIDWEMRNRAGANAAVVQPDGKLVAAGFVDSDLTIVGLTAAGKTDTSFGKNGAQQLTFEERSAAHAVAVQADGKIVVGGQAGDALVVARLTADGKLLDTTFGKNGIVQTGQNSACVNAMAIEPDGKILIAGTSWNQMLLARFNPDGSHDKSFKWNERNLFPSQPARKATAKGIVVQRDGKIVIAGHYSAYTNYTQEIALLRLERDGAEDPTFPRTAVAHLPDGIHADAVALQDDGKIVTAGFVGTTFSLARFES